MLLYEQENVGLAVQFRYLHNGMKKNHHAVCVTHEDPSIIENKMYNFGIDVDKYKGSLLEVVQVPDIMKNPEPILIQYENLMKKILEGKKLCRITGRIIKNINTMEGKLAELSIEKKLHSDIDGLNTSFLCTYLINKTKGQQEIAWTLQTIQNHHNVIYVPQQGNCTCFDSYCVTLETQLE